jgi:hypothetical protein
MPGQHITSVQVKRYMSYRKEGKTQALAAAKAGFSERSARNIEKRGGISKAKRTYRTRPDPLKAVWESEVVPCLEREPHLQARTLLDYLQARHEGEYPDKLLRTLQRRVRHWKAVHGPAKEVIFRQNHLPGQQGISDFTAGGELKITIQGSPFNHLLYHYRLPYSGWEYGQVILGGESFPALAGSLQNALWECGGCPRTHRTDSLSAAYKNLTKKELEDFTAGYEELCDNYKMEPTRNNKGKSHENGSIESANRHLKSRLDQRLMIRGSRDFCSVDEYKQFVREVVTGHNRRIHSRYLAECCHLQGLPQRRSISYTESRARVTSSSTIELKRVTYSVPSKFIGMILKCHLHDDRIECHIGPDLVLTLPREHAHRKRVQQINYRHIIHSLVRKPAAFWNYVHRDQLFPTAAFKQAWELLVGRLDSRKACREYVGILYQAAIGEREVVVNGYLERCLDAHRLPSASEVQELFWTSPHPPVVNAACGDLASYTQLLGVAQ